MTMRFNDIQDPVLRAKLEAVAAEHSGDRVQAIPPEEAQFPRYVFVRGARSTMRAIGSAVRVRNGLDEETRGGTVVAQLGRAFLVDIGDMQLLVHEPDDSWVPLVTDEDQPT